MAMIVSPATISILEATSPIASTQGKSRCAYRTTFTRAGIRSRYLGWVSAISADLRAPVENYAPRSAVNVGLSAQVYRRSECFDA
jgi:hypothetical protein